MKNFTKTPKPYSHYELLEACSLIGCPACRVGAQTVQRYLKSSFYEYVNDRDMRSNLVKSLGYCGEHVQLLLSHKIADTLGASIIYEHLVKVILREFPKDSSAGKQKELSKRISKFVSVSEGLGKCLACIQRDETINYTVRQMSTALNDVKLQEALEKSDGLCMKHLSQVLELVQKPEEADFLLTLTRSKLEARQHEMAEVIRKNDHHAHSEGITQDEGIAWRKSMSMLAGVSINLTGDKYD